MAGKVLYTMRGRQGKGAWTTDDRGPTTADRRSQTDSPRSPFGALHIRPRGEFSITVQLFAVRGARSACGAGGPKKQCTLGTVVQSTCRLTVSLSQGLACLQAEGVLRQCTLETVTLALVSGDELGSFFCSWYNMRVNLEQAEVPYD